MKILHQHQIDLMEKARSTGKRAVLLQAPTGSGKSVIASSIIKSANDKGASTWFIVPRRELLRQMARQYDDFGINYTYVAQGEKTIHNYNNKICSLQTLLRRLGSLEPPKLAVIDETHYGGKGLDVVINHLREHGSFILGLSATPWKLSGVGLGCWYDAMVTGPSIRWLIDNKFLSEYRLFAPDKIDLSGIRKSAGDYNAADLAERMESNRVLIGNVVDHYKKLAFGMRGVTFTVSRKHSEIVCNEYNQNGVPAACIDGDTPEDERRRLSIALAKKEILQLVNVDLLTFGYDLSSAAGMDVTVECMSDLRPTKSLALQMQKWGRVLRKKDTPAIIFDHANNVYEHGKPCDDREWSLKDREKVIRASSQEREISVRVCDKCYFAHKPSQICPNCGHIYPIKYREVETEDGELSEITVVKKKQARIEVGMAKTLDDLIRIGQQRGYARGWAFQIAKIKGIR